MEFLSKKIKIPQKGDDEQSYGFPTRQWDKEILDNVTVFYKSEDSRLLEDKWGVIFISLETILRRLRFASGNLGERNMVLFTEGKRYLKSVYLVFIDDKKYAEEVTRLSFDEAKKSFLNDMYILKLNFKHKLFNIPSFFLVEQCSGKTCEKRISWTRKDHKAILPVKFDNKNSNGIIDLGDILYKMFPANTYGSTKPTVYSALEMYTFSNLVANERYCLKDLVNISSAERNFFNNMNIKGILLRNSNNVILMEDDSNYLVSLSQ